MPALPVGSAAIQFARMISLHEGKGSPVKKPAERVFTLRATVVGCQPRIWRRFAVRETMWLSHLHDTIQVAFDWFDYQTHAFALDDLRLRSDLGEERIGTSQTRPRSSRPWFAELVRE